DEVARPSPRHDEHRIEADFGGCVFGMTGEPSLGRRGDPAALAFAHRFRRILEPSAGFDLDEDEDATAPRHDVDLSDRSLPAPRKDAVPLDEKHDRGAGLDRKHAARIWPKRRDKTRL